MARLLDFVQLIFDFFILCVQNLNYDIKVIVHMTLVNEIRASTHVLKKCFYFLTFFSNLSFETILQVSVKFLLKTYSFYEFKAIFCNSKKRNAGIFLWCFTVFEEY